MYPRNGGLILLVGGVALLLGSLVQAAPADRRTLAQPAAERPCNQSTRSPQRSPQPRLVGCVDPGQPNIAALWAAKGPIQAKLVPSIRKVSQTHHDRSLNATFSVGMAPDGSAWTGVKAHELKVDKWVRASGETTLVVNYRDDTVTIVVNGGGYRVSRGTRSASLERNDRREDRLTAIRSVLLGSPAARVFRAFTAALEGREGDENVAMLSTLVDGALVGALDGDPSAIDRVGRRIANRMRPGARRVQGSPVQFTDCVTQYELSALRDYNAYRQCVSAAIDPWWEASLFLPMCSLEFFLRSQQNIWQFITCMAFPN